MHILKSRISRLKLPCFAPKYSEKLEKGREIAESTINDGQSAQLLNVDNMRLSQSYEELKFDQREAFRVGVMFMLMINSILLIIAATYLGYQGALESIWILFLSMIIAPTICSCIGIKLFAHLINHNIHLCQCCVDTANMGKRLKQSMGSPKLSISLKVTDSESVSVE